MRGGALLAGEADVVRLQPSKLHQASSTLVARSSYAYAHTTHPGPDGQVPARHAGKAGSIPAGCIWASMPSGASGVRNAAVASSTLVWSTSCSRGPACRWGRAGLAVWLWRVRLSSGPSSRGGCMSVAATGLCKLGVIGSTPITSIHARRAGRVEAALSHGAIAGFESPVEHFLARRSMLRRSDAGWRSQVISLGP